MKKSLCFGMFAAAGLLLATSCQTDELETTLESGNEATVSFSVSLENGAQTRTISDGNTVDELIFAVYKDGALITPTGADTNSQFTGTLSNGTGTASVTLTKKQTYTVVFWAQNSECGCYDTSDLTAVTVDYSSTGTDETTTTTPAPNNDESRDAFYKAEEITVTGSGTIPVTLNRPFAQINVGVTTADWEAAVASGVEIAESSVTIKQAATQINLLTGAVSGDATDVTYASATIPAKFDTPETLSVDTDGDGTIEEGETYNWLSMSYILVNNTTNGAASSTVDASFAFSSDGNDITLDVSNIPVQRNYRTNIIGKILTGDLDFNIVIDNKFEEDTADKTMNIWDGSISEPSYDENTSTYTINNASELAWIAAQVNGTADAQGAKAAPLTKATTYNTFSGKKVILASDIYLGNQPWTPIGNVAAYPSRTFAGTFDGNGKTIYDLNVTDKTERYASAGLFGSTTGTIQNVTVKNATVISSHYAGVIVGYISQASGSSVEISNCIVEDAVISTSPELLIATQADVNSGDATTVGEAFYNNGDKAGGIVGYTASVVNITGCSVTNTTITGYRDLGGIVGYYGGTGTLSSCTIDNVTININAEHNYKNYTTQSAHNVGNYIGRGSATVDASNSGEATINYDVQIVETTEELASVIAAAGAASSGDTVIIIDEDITFGDDETWTPVDIDGYHGADVITIYGNGHTISNISAPLFASGFAGGCGLVVYDLTIADSKIVSTNTVGAGAFIGYVDSMDKVTLDNCHLLNSTISDTQTYFVGAGGLIGYTAGWNGEGPVDTYVTVTDCSVEGCTITGVESAAGIIGHAGGNVSTWNTIENCQVIDCTIVSTCSDYCVGGIVGTAHIGEVVINNCTVDDDTISKMSNGSVEHPDGQSYLYGRFVPGTTGKLYIDDVEITL